MNLLDYGLSQGRTPSFDARGNIRGFRSRPGAPPAEPPQGLGPPPGAGSGTNAMSASSWVNTFRNTGPAIQRQALAERVQMPGMTGSQMFSGISQPIINEFMEQTPSAVAARTFVNPFNSVASGNLSNSIGSYGATSMLTNPLSSPFGAAILGGSPAPTATATATAAPAFDQSTASMMRDWLRTKAPVRSQWQNDVGYEDPTRQKEAYRDMFGRTIGESGVKSFSRDGAPQIYSSRYGWGRNTAPSFAWNRAFMNG